MCSILLVGKGKNIVCITEFSFDEIQYKNGESFMKQF